MFKRDTEVYDLADPAVNALLRDRIKKTRVPVYFCCEPYKPQRTLAQNAYWHGIVLPCLVQFFQEGTGDSGWNKESVHYFSREFWLDPVETHTPDGKIFRRPKSTTELDVADFGKLVDSAIEWLATFGIIVPPPSKFTKGDG